MITFWSAAGQAALFLMACDDEVKKTPETRNTTQEKTAELWDLVWRDYSASDLTLDGICARHGISKSRLHRYRELHGWPKRPSLAERRRNQLRSPQAVNKQPYPAATAGPGRRLEMIERLYGVLEQELKDFETRYQLDGAADSAEVSRADRERSARTLTALIRSYDKITEFDDKARQALKTSGPSEPDPDCDADSLRSEIARRLERLLASHGRGDVPGNPDGEATQGA